MKKSTTSNIIKDLVIASVSFFATLIIVKIITGDAFSFTENRVDIAVCFTVYLVIYGTILFFKHKLNNKK